jgi:hypothetical protein
VARYLFEEILGRLVVVPETGLDRTSLKFGYLLLSLIEVKDTSLACRDGLYIEVSDF